MTRRQVTITLTRYREPDWLVDEALASLAGQEGVAGEVLFLDQNWREDYARSVSARSNDRLTFKAIDCDARCLSHARNEGLRLAAHPLVLFAEPDILAAPDWALALADALIDGASVAGSRILPKWRGRPPLLARAKTVLDQYSMLDWGEATIDAHRIVGAGFGVNKALLDPALHFDERFGRRDGVLTGGEESVFCREVSKRGGRIVYAGAAVIEHQVLSERLTWSWVLRRLYHAGAARRQQGGAPSPSRKPGLWDWLLAPIILPPYALGYVRARLAATPR